MLRHKFSTRKTGKLRAPWAASIYYETQLGVFQGVLTYFEGARGHRFSKKRECGGPEHAVLYVYTLFHKSVGTSLFIKSARAAPPFFSEAPSSGAVAIAAITRTNMANFDAIFLSRSPKREQRISFISPTSELNSAAGCIRKRATPDSSLPFWDRLAMCVCVHSHTDSSITRNCEGSGLAP